VKLRIIYLGVLLLISRIITGQTTITGIVSDSLNNPVPFATVYLSKTSSGTYTDQNGSYSLNIPHEGAYEMVVSCIGYKLNSQTIYVKGSGQKINIKLQGTVFMLSEVTIKAKDKNRRKNYNQFIKSFLGETSNSQSCKILNPEDLHLYRDPRNDILRGYSLNPIKIENNALGYNISYDLVDFSYDNKTGIVRYSGYNYFQPLSGSERSNKLREKNKLATYYGSKMHFLRALFSDSLSRQNYRLSECRFDSVKKKFSAVKPVQFNYIRFLNTRPFITLLYNDSITISYTDNNPGLKADQLAPESITEGIFSDSLKRENYRVFKNKTDTSFNKFPGIKNVPDNDVKSLSDKNYVTLFYANPLMITYTDRRSKFATENPILQLDDKIRASNKILSAQKEEWIKPFDETPQLNLREYESILSFSDTLWLFRNGYYYEPYSILWAGAMALERIGDMLPLDFLPYEYTEEKADTAFKLSEVSGEDSVKAESTHFAEKVYIHTDRDNYIPGDDIWFKSYLIDALTNIPAAYACNLHVELLSPESEILQSRVLRADKGLANGDFHLPDSILSGDYLIRAYTNYMRNFDDQFFFRKKIAVMNPADAGRATDDSVRFVKDKIDIAFFPEGGSLVDSISSTVAFKAVNALGKGCEISGEIFSSRGDLITTIESNYLGLGSFALEPEAGLSYYAVIDGPDNTKAKAFLPESFETGTVMRAVMTQNKRLLIAFRTNEKTLPLISGHDLILSFSSRNLITWNTTVRINFLYNEFIISTEDLPEGIIRISLSGSEGLPLCERLIYIPNPNDVRLNVTTDKKVYKPREQISAKVSLSGNLLSAGETSLSLSAAESHPADKNSFWPTTIASWFLLESDVHGPVEEPSYYFDPANKNRFPDLDLLLLTQGWRDFKWKYDSLSSYRNEFGFNLSGNVKRTLSDKNIEGAKINLGIFSKPYQFFNTTTDSSGAFRFKGLDFHGKTIAFISSTGKYEKIEGRIFIDSIHYEPAQIKKTANVRTELILHPVNNISYIQEASYRMAIKKKYKLRDTLNLGEVFITAKRVETPEEIKVKESRRVYGIPDKELIVTPAQENYGGDVFGYMSGRLPGVRIIQDTERSDSVLILIRGQKSIGPDGSVIGALVLLDGKEVLPQDYSTLQMLTMKMIDRIDVLNASPLYGMRGANGVINIITRVGIRRDPFEPTANTASLKINGFDSPRVFYSPKYNDPATRTYIPDLRTTIFWEPNITMDKVNNMTLNFYNADTPSTIRVVVEGMTSSGIPLSAKTEYKIE
jgi:hypothetical protein